MELKKKFPALFLVCFMLLCTGSALKAAPFEQENQSIRVGVDINMPPYSYVDDNGMIKGFNVDLVRAVAIEIGMDIELYAQTAADLNNNLLSRGLDAIVSNQDHSPSLLASKELIESQDTIFVREDNQYISDLEGFWSSPVAINTQSLTPLIGTYLDKYPLESPKIVMSQEHGFLLLMNKEVDSYIGNKSAGMYLIQKWNQEDYIKAVGEPFNISSYAFYTNAADKTLMSQLNNGLEAVFSNKSYEKIYEKWFGESIASYNRKIRSYFLAIALVAILALLIMALALKWRTTLKKEVERRTEELNKAYSKERQLQEELTKVDRMKSLDLLVSEFVHEIRTPLTSIKTMAELLPNKINNADFRRNMTEIVTMEVSRLDNMVSSLSEYARPKPANPSSFDIKVLLDSVLLLLLRKCNEKRVALDINMPACCLVCGDSMELMQVFINLILNSLESIQDGGAITIGSHKTAEGHIAVTISDNGPGIPEEYMEKITEPFFTTRPSGTGLGLYICRRLLEKNQGRLILESQIGIGTKATVILS